MAAGQHTFKVHGSEILVDSPILGVRRDQVEMPGGAISRREIVEHFGAVAVVAHRVDERGEDEIAMVKQYRHCVMQRLWELPAGILDIAHEPELDCAKRELEEEAGLAAGSWGVLVDLVTSPGFCEEAVRVFLAEDLRDIPRPESTDEEADMAFQWVRLEDAQAMIFRGEIVNSIAIAGIMTASAVLSGQAEVRPVETPFEFRPTHLAKRRIEQGIQPDMKRL